MDCSQYYRQGHALVAALGAGGAGDKVHTNRLGSAPYMELFIHSNLEKGQSAKLLRLLGKELRYGTSLGLLSVGLYSSRDKESGAACGFIRLELDGREPAFLHSAQQNSAKTFPTRRQG